MKQDTPKIVGSPPPRLFNEADAATYLGLSRSLLRRQRCEGQRDGHVPMVPYIRAGRSIRYDIADLDAWIESNKVAGASS